MVSGYYLQYSYSLGRRGREIIPKTVVRAAPTIVRHARERTIGVRGAQMFNLLPEQLRSMNSDHVDMFKNHLDVFLSSIPDQPTMTWVVYSSNKRREILGLPSPRDII